MPTVNCIVETEVSNSPRARQVEALFDVPRQEKARLEWHGEIPIEEKDWSIGLIVGPSGCGKSTILEGTFGKPRKLKWKGASVIDDVAEGMPVSDVSEAFSAVGFNTIPAWLRPFKVLSNGEQFRVQLARTILEADGLITIDEFTSVVDRQVAKVASHAAQKYIRRRGKQMVVASCHYDIVDWLQPDWILEPAGMKFTWRSLQQRPTLQVEIGRAQYGLWNSFAPYHYLTASLNKTARCFASWVDGRAVAFTGILPFPHPVVKDIVRCSRLVTLPDWQGLGFAFQLIDTVAAAYTGIGKRLRTYPAHPAFIRSFGKSDKWKLVKKPGTFQPRAGRSSSVKGIVQQRPCATFEYIGEAMDDLQARDMLALRH